ncbi:MAG TPA: AEC family transporter [Candidatus Cloacimonadota bacterium]|nr:AEC family transporter [Candidatus Cloacimonadota bacterium]HPT71296.1 AEC family transporter [Candidatus Cloacimonadota bacterium]
MQEFIHKIVPIILAFFLGIFIKKIKLLKKDDGHLLLKLVLSVTLPALQILSILRLQLTWSLFFIPLIAQMIIIIVYFVSLGTGRLLKLPKGTMGSFLVGTMIMNTSFSLPFFFAAFGQEGFARATLFDVGNSFLIFTFIYYNAIKYGENSQHHAKVDWIKFLKLPPLWGLVIGVVMRLVNIQLPEIGMNFLSLVGNPTTPLIMISLGLFFEPKLKNLDKALLAIFIRMVGGLGLGILLSSLFHLQGMNRTIVIASASTPIGFNTLIFASLEGMDEEFAATCVSISILIAIVYLPAVIYLFT